MIVYQLVARGPMALFNSTGKFYSKKVFRYSSDAENYKGEFSEICTSTQGDEDIVYLERIDKISVVQLEVSG